MTPNGKIGRLPKALRDEVNRRLENGQKARPLLSWLNGLPEVQAMLAAEFNGQPINEKNLCKWRKFGFKNWALRREAQAMSAEIGELPTAANSPVPDQVTIWASVRYLMVVRELVEKTSPGPSRLKLLRELVHDAIALRRGEQRGARLKMQLESLGREHTS